MEITPYLHRDLTFHLPNVDSRDELFMLIARTVKAMQPDTDEQVLYQCLVDREKQMPTSTPDGVAFPHALAPQVEQTLVIAAYVAGGVDFGVTGHPPSDLILCLLGSSENPWEHVRLLARLARLVHTESSRQNLRSTDDADDFYQRLQEEDRSHE